MNKNISVLNGLMITPLSGLVLSWLNAASSCVVETTQTPLSRNTAEVDLLMVIPEACNRHIYSVIKHLKSE